MKLNFIRLKDGTEIICESYSMTRSLDSVMFTITFDTVYGLCTDKKYRYYFFRGGVIDSVLIYYPVMICDKKELVSSVPFSDLGINVRSVNIREQDSRSARVESAWSVSMHGNGAIFPNPDNRATMIFSITDAKLLSELSHDRAVQDKEIWAMKQRFQANPEGLLRRLWNVMITKIW